MPIPTLSTVKQFSAKYPAWSEASVRWNVFNADKNGLAEAGAIIRDGGKVLINEEKWFEVKLNFREGLNNSLFSA